MRVWMARYRGERTQAQVAREAGICQSSYSMIESGRRRPSVETARRIARALGADWRLFFEEEENTHEER